MLGRGPSRNPGSLFVAPCSPVGQDTGGTTGAAGSPKPPGSRCHPAGELVPPGSHGENDLSLVDAQDPDAFGVLNRLAALGDEVIARKWLGPQAGLACGHLGASMPIRMACGD